MESGYDEFAKALEAKIQERVLPLEEQLNHQQEIITKLTQTLQSLLEVLQKNHDLKADSKAKTTLGTNGRKTTRSAQEKLEDKGKTREVVSEPVHEKEESS